ncbi:MAG: Phosphoenolpyruvate synthase [Candidatus Parcubacteria bacterium]|jgi:phosphohistidine swiveling domain-containing protein
MISLQHNYKKLFERKNSFFVFCISVLAHSSRFERATGKGFESLAFAYRDDMGTMFNIPEDLISLQNFYRNLIQNNSPVLWEAYTKATALNLEIDAVISHYKNSSRISDKAEFAQHIELLTANFTYSTVVPYWVLSSVTDAEKDLEIVAKFEELRGQTRYPQFVANVIEKYYAYLSEITAIEATLFSYLTPKELGAVLDNPTLFNREIIEKRRGGCVAIFSNETGEFEVEYGNEAVSRFFAQIEVSKHITTATIITGNSAFRGIVRGRVSIINSLKDLHKMKDGDVIVSINTSPSLMSAIAQCSAIVTDEGGIMCHAAIISRELQKPCVIGTKVATQVFNDGDVVEVDADKGVVRVL